MTKQDNIIIIEGGSYINVKKALKDWINLYVESIDPDVEFELYNDGGARHIIKIENNLSNELFNYLVNYLEYPEGINYKVTVEGYTVANDKHIYPKDCINKYIQVFIPENDREHENVFVASEDNGVYKIDFGGTVSKIESDKKFTKFEFDFSDLMPSEKVKADKTEKYQKEITEEESKRISGRIKIVSIIVFSLFILSFYFIQNTHNFILINYAMSFGVSCWFFFDYRMLQDNTNYLKLVFISLLILLYGHFATQRIGGVEIELIKLGMITPITFLLIQRPFRLLFKYIKKREPIVEKPAPSFADGVYMFLLFISFIILSIGFINYASLHMI